MLSKFLLRKLLILYTCMFVIGFFIGYDYALITSKQSQANQIEKNTKIDVLETNKTGLTDYSVEDIINSD